MGAKLSYGNFDDSPGPNDVDFFQSIQMRWLDYFCDSLEEMAIPKLDIEDQELLIPWRAYFSIFSRIVEMKKSEDREIEKSRWHVVCNGYEMVRGPMKYTAKKIPGRVWDDVILEEAHTDDEPSEVDSDEENSDEEDDAETEKEDNEDDDNVDADEGSTKNGSDAENENSNIDNDNTEGKKNQDENTEDVDNKSKLEQKGINDDGTDGTGNNDEEMKEELTQQDEGNSDDGDDVSKVDTDPRKTFHAALKAQDKEKALWTEPEPELEPGQLPDGWDSSKISPIFFGYSFRLTLEREEEERIEREERDAREKEAIAQAEGIRGTLMQEFEEAIGRRAKNRLDKMAELKKSYEESVEARHSEYNRNEKELPEAAWATYKRQWEREYDSSEEAYKHEMARLEEIHERKTTADRIELLNKKQDIEAFKDAEAQEIPSADRLEQISRVEMHRWIDELDISTKELDKSRLEYLDLRGEIEVNLKHEDPLKRKEAAMLINAAESRVRERRSAVEEGVRSLENSEILLKRAIRIKAQQDVLLPLFKLLTRVEVPQASRFDLSIAAFLILLQGTFDEKVTFLLRRFDLGREGWFTSHHIATIAYMFQEASVRLHYLPLTATPSHEEIISSVLRAFLERKLSPTGVITAFEGKEMLLQMINMCGPLCEAFGVPNNDTFCTYQRNNMSAFALMTHSIVGPGTCKYRQHFEQIQYKPCLEPTWKQNIHERAMDMGDEDPTRADYTVFIKKKQKPSASNVVELGHGHQYNNLHLLNQIENSAAVKLQAMFRSRRDRRIADHNAKRQAFEESKITAMQEVKAAVTKEFKKREGLPAAKRFKWDAQIRMRQAKLRAAGTTVTRNEVVSLIMEEAMAKAGTEVEERFNEIARKEGFEDNIKEIIREDRPADVMDMFGVLLKPAFQDAEGTVDVSTPRPDDEDDDVDNDDGNNEAAIAKQEDQLVRLSEERSKAILSAAYRFDPVAKGETKVEFDLRMMMSQAEPESEKLLNFMLVNHVSLYRASDIIKEIPTKRLLLRYVEAVGPDKLLDEIRYHFCVTKKHDLFAKSLQNMIGMDLERGIFLQRLFSLQETNDACLKTLVDNDQRKTISDLEATINARVSNNANMDEEAVFQMEKYKLDTLLDRYQDLALKMLEDLINTRNRFLRTNISVKEIERRHRCLRRLHDQRLGREPKTEVVLDDRQGWMKRLNWALVYPDTTPAYAEVKYSEVRNVCKDFLTVARADAMIIINEYYQPPYAKTIQPVQSRHVHGRPKVSGRGLDGKTFIFEAHNIEYRIYNDDDGIFNGSDEYAMKAASLDRLGSQQYIAVHVKTLNVPLVTTVDYLGFRVLCVAKVPSKRILLNEEGEVRKISEEMLHGLVNEGDEFYNKSALVSRLLRTAGTRLGLCEHHVRGLRDIQSSVTAASSELKVYLGTDEEFYCKDFWRCFPSEDPEVTTHLMRSPRDQSIFWRQLRPEFVRQQHNGLSPDAYTLVVGDGVRFGGTPDREKQIEDVKVATSKLITEIIPKLTLYLSERDYDMPLSQGLGLDLPYEMHIRGINMRHLGLIRSLIWHPLPGKLKLFFNEKSIKTSSDCREEVREGDLIRLNVKGQDVEFTASTSRSSKKKESSSSTFTHSQIPVDHEYRGESVAGLDGRVGTKEIPTEKNSDDLRLILLCEMIARTVKNIIRLQLRNYAATNKATSPEFMTTLLVEYLNIITGSSSQSCSVLQQDIYMGIRERFGTYAVTPAERENLHQYIAPGIIHCVKRLQMMMGVTLSVTCVAEFNSHPKAFTFTTLDVLEIVPVIRHNIPYLKYSEAKLASLRAAYAEEEVFPVQVLMDKPTIYLPLSERKGARKAINRGSVGIFGQGNHARGNELEAAGPLANETVNRSVYFDGEAKSKVDVAWHESYMPVELSTHFSFEVLIKPKEAFGTKVVLMSGRYALLLSRELQWTFVFVYHNIELYLRICPAEMDSWQHITCTFDGTTMRGYFNGDLHASLEVDPSIHAAERDYNDEREEEYQSLRDQEEEERKDLKENTKREAEKFFGTKEGQAQMKQAQANIMESNEFQRKNYGSDAPDPLTATKIKRQEALKQAKKTYVTELYLKNGKDLTQKYIEYKEEIEERVRKYKEEGEIRTKKGLRIGASNSKDTPDKFFNGFISHVCIYSKCVNQDRIVKHYLSYSVDRLKDAQRMHAVASAKYEEALRHSAGDLLILKAAAESLCSYLKLELATGNLDTITKGKERVKMTIRDFQHSNEANGIAEVLALIPQDPSFADLCCFCFRALQDTDPAYFSGGIGLSREDLAIYPKLFGLDDLDGDPYFIDTAARMYKEVMKDSKLQLFYGEVDLNWITQIKCAELVVALVKFSSEDRHLNVVNVGQVYKECGRDSLSIDDHDVEMLAYNLSISTGFDFSQCRSLTNDAVKSLRQLNKLRVVILDGCTLIDDDACGYLAEVSEFLEVVSLAGLQRISDNGLITLGAVCQRLQVLNVNNCPAVSYDGIVGAVRNNRKISTLMASGTQIDDSGLSSISNYLSKKNFTSIDLSFCREISDFGIASLTQQCPGLVHVNFCGLHRITDEGCRSIVRSCWYLRTLNLEDNFLLDETPFFYDRKADGRQAADENMLKTLTLVNFKDCVNLRDNAFEGLKERCRMIEQLNLTGCDKLTDAALQLMTDPVPYKVPLCDSIRVLDLTSCRSMSLNGILKFLPECGVLEDLNLSALPGVDDEFIHRLCLAVPTILKLSLQRCLLVTDKMLCSIADFLMLQSLDVSFCTKLTDAGIEVLALACSTGLERLMIRRCKISPSGINALSRNCFKLKELDVRECSRVTDDCLDDLIRRQKFVKVYK